MCCFFIVIKLLMLKILLAGLTGLNTAARYDYGYHPSAEEFDNLLRETRRTWTHTFLKAERDRVPMKPAERYYKAEASYFVPKFQYENSESIKFKGFKPSPLKKQNIKLAATQKPDKPLQNIGSSLQFNYFSDELPQPLQQQQQQQPTLATTTVEVLQDTRIPVSSAKPEINLKPLGKPEVLTGHNYSLNTIYRNKSQTDYPIYFSNPATGIVYAITELGKSTQNMTKQTNGSIPIFIAKEQYERDIRQLEKMYKQKCQNLRILSTTAPTIIRLEKPLAAIRPINSSAFSATNATLKPLKHHSSVLVKTELIVKDQKPLTRPLRKKQKNKLKPKLKLKKHKAPGHKTMSTTIRPILLNQPEGPKIIIGTRTLKGKHYKDNENLPTQLEKPDFESIFSGTALTHETKFNRGILKPLHKVNKRSVEKTFEKINKLMKVKNVKNNSLKIEKISSNEKIHLKDFAKNKLNNKQNKTRKILSGDFWSKSLSPRNAHSKESAKLSEEIRKTNFTTDLVKRFLNLNNKTQENLASLNENNSEFNKQNNNLKNKQARLKIKPLLNTISEKQKENIKLKIFNNKNLSNNIKKNVLEMANDSKSKNLLLNSIATNIINSKENNLQISFDSTKNSSFKQLNNHHIKKRSAEDLSKTNSTLIKFVKKSNENQINQKNFTNNDHELKINLENSKLLNETKLNILNPINSTIIKKNFSTKLPGNGNEKDTVKRLKKLKRLSKVQTNITTQVKTAARTNKLINRKRAAHKSKKMEKKSKGKQDTEYYFFDVEENYDEDEDEEDTEDDEYEDDDEQEHDEELEAEAEQEDYKDQNDILAYDDDSYQTHTMEAGLSVEDLNEKGTENSVLEVEKVDLKDPLVNDDNEDSEIGLKTKTTYIKKRFRRRPTPDDEYDDDDDDDEDSSISSNLAGFFRMIFYPIQVVMSSVMDSFGGKDADEEDNGYAQYTPYHKTVKQHDTDEYDDEEDYEYPESSGSSLGSWLSSWFSFNRRNKKIGSTTVAPIKRKPTKTSSSWLPTWLTFGANDRISTEAASNEHNDSEYDKWFASWFGEMKPRGRKRTTTTTTTTQIPQVPILTIVDPMRNPQNWIGILAHHIINHTSTSTINPLKDIWNTVTSTTTENPEIPRKISYDKYQIWRLKPQDDSQVKALEEYKKSEDGIKLQWLKGPSLRGLTDVLVPPKMLLDFQASLTFELIDHEVLIFDVGKAIAYEQSKEDYFITTTQRPKKHHGKNPSTIASMTWHKYYEYDDIIKYLETMRMRFPHLVDLIHIGRSYEGRPLIVMKIESKEAAAVNSAHYTAHQHNKLRHKKRIGLANAVFIEAGTHGTEWIGPATATWTINELLRIMKKNVTDDQSFIRNTTWFIMPVLNPDGYVYTHEFDRFWKKSRSRHVSRPSGILSSAMTWLQKKRAKEKICFGVDLDRNWHYQWARRGSSKSACNEFYAGPTPFSEPETKALSEFLMDYRTQIKLFVSMQSYGQIISYPYKANTTYDTERLDDLLDVAMVGTDGLRKKGSKSRYKIDSSNDLVENRSGCSDAFAAYEAGIPFSYTLQLADNGVHGYLLPSASIESTAKDSFEIITGMLDYI